MKKTSTIILLLLLAVSVSFAQSKKQETFKKHFNNNKKIEKTAVKTPNSTTAATQYDFTTSSDKFYGGTSGAVEVETGVWGMVAGDANGDGQITSLDYDLWLPEAKTASTGYLATDMNLDGQNTSLDYDIWLPNAKSAKSSQVPN